MPLVPLITLLARQNKDLENCVFHHAAVDERTQRLFVYVESVTPHDGSTTHAIPTDIDIDWSEYFGYIHCEGCGCLHPVENITACAQCASTISKTEEIVEKHFGPSAVKVVSMAPKPIWKGAAQGNFRKGRTANAKPMTVVIHLMDGTLVGTDAWFNTPRPKAPTSAHYGIGKNGALHQYVLESDTAYHAGVPAGYTGTTWKLWDHHTNPNDLTIGIEHEGTIHDVWTPAMLDVSTSLCADICARYGIPVDRDHIIGHSEIWPPHNCPGPLCNLDDYVKKVVAKLTSA